MIYVVGEGQGGLLRQIWFWWGVLLISLDKIEIMEGNNSNKKGFLNMFSGINENAAVEEETMNKMNAAQMGGKRRNKNKSRKNKNKSRKNKKSRKANKSKNMKKSRKANKNKSRKNKNKNSRRNKH